MAELDATAWTDAVRRGPRSRRTAAGPGRAMVGVAFLGLLAAAAVLVPMLSGLSSSAVDYDEVLRAPSGAHVFGTDSSGRDVLVRTAEGVRVSLLIAGACAVLSALIGTTVGVLSGAAGGWLDRIAMRVVDTVNAVPHLLLGIVVVALYRGSLAAIVASIALTHWTSVARIVRAETLSLRRLEYVDAAVLGGASRRRVARVHLLPAVLPQAALATVLLVPHAVWHETALSFLGLGLPPHQPSLGTLLDEGRDTVLLGAWWTVAIPSAFLIGTTLAVSACGAAWRDRLVPRRRTEAVL
jgi:peptide/nickel transport system permease protein